MMYLKKVATLAAAAALVVSPALAQAQSIAVPAPAVEQVAGEQMFGENQGVAIGLGFLVLVALMAAIVSGSGDRDLDAGRPISP